MVHNLMWCFGKVARPINIDKKSFNPGHLTINITLTAKSYDNQYARNARFDKVYCRLVAYFSLSVYCQVLVKTQWKFPPWSSCKSGDEKTRNLEHGKAFGRGCTCVICDYRNSWRTESRTHVCVFRLRIGSKHQLVCWEDVLVTSPLQGLKYLWPVLWIPWLGTSSILRY